MLTNTRKSPLFGGNANEPQSFFPLLGLALLSLGFTGLFICFFFGLAVAALVPHTRPRALV